MDQNDKELWEAAAILVQAHGAAALEYVEARLKAAQDDGDYAVYSAWLSVREAVSELLRTAEQGETIN